MSIKLVLLGFIILYFLMPVNCVAQEKKPYIILYENGTWEKVTTESKVPAGKSISSVWKEFQESVKKCEKKEISNYFIFPFNIEVDVEEYAEKTFEMGCIKPICKLAGAVSQKKFEGNFDFLFSQEFKDAILQVNPDEYTEGKSDRFGKTNYTFELKVEAQFNNYEYINNQKTIISKKGYISYMVYFLNTDQGIKIYLITAERIK